VTSGKSVRCELRGNFKKKKRRGVKGDEKVEEEKVEERCRRHHVICGKQIIVRAANHSARWPTSVRELARDENPPIYWPTFFRLVFERHHRRRSPCRNSSFFGFFQLSLNLDWRMFVLLNEIQR